MLKAQNSWAEELERSLIAATLAPEPILLNSLVKTGKKLPRPGNILEWVLEPGYLSSDAAGISLYPSQYVLLRDFYELLCPVCNDLGSLLNTWDLKKGLEQFAGETYLRFGVCPTCGITRKELAERGLYHEYNEFVGASGSRSGKTVLGGILGSFQTQEILCMEEPWKVYGLIPNAMLEIAFCAVSGKQAADTIWSQFRSLYDNSPWFQAYAKELRTLEIDPNSSYHKEELYKESGDQIFFNDKRLRLIRLHSNSASLSGRTRIGSYIDELAKFDQTESKRSATEVYRTLKQGLLTVRLWVRQQRRLGNYDLPDALQVEISSPLFPDDKIMELEETAKTKPRMFAFRRASWDLNPNLDYEDLAEEYADDLTALMRDFGAEPMDAQLAFSADLVERGIGTQGPVVLIKDTFFSSQDPRTGEETRYVKPELIHCITDKITERVLVADAGNVGDSFGIAIAHKELSGNQVIYVYDAMIEIRPVPSRSGMPAHEVHFQSVENFLAELGGRLNLVLISLDRWQQIQTVQNLKDRGLSVVARNVSSQDYVDFRVDMHQKALQILPPETSLGDQKGRGMPCAKAIWELRNMRDISGKMVKGPKASDDLCQCIVGCHHHLREMSLGLHGQRSMFSGRSMASFEGRSVRFRR